MGSATTHIDSETAGNLSRLIHGPALHRLFAVPDLPPLYLVGGSVRDCILGAVPKDIDLICHDAEDVSKRIARRAGGTCVPFLKNREMPCYRVAFPGPDAVGLDISPVFGGAVDTDLARRDFTINAMAVPVQAGAAFRPCLIDPLDGLEDIRRRRIRMTHARAFDDDPLRILRCIRFSAQLGYAVEAETLAWMARAREGLERISAERIWQELRAILRTPRTAWAFQVMALSGVLGHVLPEVIPVMGCRQGGYHHLDVWEHSLLVLTYIESILSNPAAWFPDHFMEVQEYFREGGRYELMKLGALLHDVGKPATRSVTARRGRTSFIGHPERGVKMTEAICRRLRVSSEERAFLTRLVGQHMYALALSAPRVKRRTLLRWFRKTGREVIALVVHAVADVHSTRGPLSSHAFREQVTGWARRTLADLFTAAGPMFREPNLLTGSDLIRLGVAPGPHMGEIIRQVREEQDLGRIHDRAQALSLASSMIAKSGAAPAPGRDPGAPEQV